MYGSLDFGTINLTQVTVYMSDLWAMFQPVILLALAFAAFGALLYLGVGALISAFGRR